MRKKIYIITRYSVVSKKRYKDWVAGKEASSYEEYKRLILCPERLERRRGIFFNITVPSLKNMMPCEGVDVDFVVLASKDMPSAEKKELELGLSSLDSSRVIYLGDDVRSFGDIIREKVVDVSEEAIFATVRLDDDDALASSFVKELGKYLKEEFVDCCVSFGQGIEAIYDEEVGRVTSVKDKYFPKIALGLSHINYFSGETRSLYTGSNIYSIGTHTKVDKKCRLILDSRFISFLRVVHEDSDFRKASEVDGKSIEDYEFLRDKFGILG